MPLLLVSILGCENPFGEADTVGSNLLPSEGIPLDITPPTSPTALVLSGDPLLAASPTISWNSAVDDVAISSYQVGVGTNSTLDNVVAFTSVGNLNSYNVTGITPLLDSSLTYYILIKAIDSSGNESEVVASTSWAPGLVTDTGALQIPESPSALENCEEYIASGYYDADGDGVYWIDPDGAGIDPKFKVYCDMTTDGGGWTLVDNVAVLGEKFTSRMAGANFDISTTRGSVLPSYMWSATPKLMCKSSRYSGTQDWLTFNVLTAGARGYPTTQDPNLVGGVAGHFSVATLNGNTNQGVSAWVYATAGRIGSVWIGNGGAPTCACNYTANGSTGLGSFVNSNATCSTWVK